MKLSLVAPLILAAVALPAADKPFVALFDGKSLKGWEVCNGKAEYRVEKGEIVGRTAEGSPNSFLCTTREYGDFILEFETKTDPRLNSGVQIRSHRYPEDRVVQTFDGKKTSEQKQQKGRVHGYQVEISTHASGASGGIYDEARRGWVAQAPAELKANSPFQDSEWNKYRVEAYGDTIKVSVNGVPTVTLVDPLDQAGFIALQVHSFKGDTPAEVRWRNIRIQDNGKHVWKPIWDGKTFNGWRKQGGGSFEIVDGAIRGQSAPDDTRIGFLISDQSFKDLTIRTRFKILKGNSGFFVRTDPADMSSYEVEIDAEKQTGGFYETGPKGRKWVTGPEDNAVVRSVGEWNEMTASLHGHRVVFHVNGVKTMELLNDTIGRLEGQIALQAHGSRRPTEVWFKDIAVLVPEK